MDWAWSLYNRLVVKFNTAATFPGTMLSFLFCNVLLVQLAWMYRYYEEQSKTAKIIL